MYVQVHENVQTLAFKYILSITRNILNFHQYFCENITMYKKNDERYLAWTQFVNFFIKYGRNEYIVFPRWSEI